MIPLDRYPKEIVLRDGVPIVFRPMIRDDVDRLWSFFREVSPEDKMFFRENVDRREVVQRWAETLDFDAVLPILALSAGRVVGDATLHRNKTGWKQRIGTVRILIAPDFRQRGLGTAMIRELRHLGEKASLLYLVGEVVEEQQTTIRAFERMGFEKAIVYRNFVNDQKGHLHNLVVLLDTLSASEDDLFY
jgi:RimJ/RimL family protein N-acetyltransferase